MSRMPRNISQSGVYHILFRGVNKQNIFDEESDYKKLEETIYKVKEDMGFEIYAYCFMSNHVHLVVKEKNAKDISLIMKRILTKYARWYNIKYERSGALIANRYKSVPVEMDEYFLQLIRYVHQNPVKAGITDKISNYRYSSYREYMGERELTDTELVMSMMCKEEFMEFHKEMGEVEFRVTDSVKKTDEEMKRDLYKEFGIKNAKEVSGMGKEEKNKVLMELKKKYPARQIQRVTGVSRGLISKL